MHDLPGDDLHVLEPHAAAHLQSGGLGQLLLAGEEHGGHDHAVPQPLHLGLDLFGAGPPKLLGLGHAHVHVVLLIELVDEDDLVRVLQGAAADKGGGVLGIAAVLLHVVPAVMGGDGGHVVGSPLYDGAHAHARVDPPGDAVPVPLRVHARIHEHALLHGVEVPALGEHLLHEEDRPLLQLPGLLPKVPVLLQLHHVHETVHAHQGLLGRVAGLNVVDVPGHVSPLVGGDGGLNVRAGELGDQHVQHVGDGSLPGAGLDILGVHLGPHPIPRKEVPERHRVGQVHMHAGGRGGRGRHGGQADVFLGDARLVGE